MTGKFITFRASLETPISHGILIFLRENELNSLGKMRIPWEIGVSKLALSIIDIGIIKMTVVL
jgi:hypothetical protein